MIECMRHMGKFNFTLNNKEKSECKNTNKNVNKSKENK